jgi:hypothetical protein
MEAFQSEVPDRADDMLPAYVGLLARVDKAEAEKRIRAVLLSKSAAKETALLRLAEVAASAGISLDQDLLDLSETVHGVSPRLALAKAVARARLAGDDAGLQLIDDMRKRAGTGSASLDWDLVRTSFLDNAHRAEAGPAWVRLSDDHPGALEAQLGALASQAAWKDHDAIATMAQAYDALDVKANYYAMIMLIDDQLRRIVDVLRDTGQLDDTIIVYMSDHGELLGDHGLILKGCRFFEGLVRVPLVFSWPGRFGPGVASDALSSTVPVPSWLAGSRNTAPGG